MAQVHSPLVYTSQGVPISVNGTAQVQGVWHYKVSWSQVKINGSNKEMLKFAAEQFGSKSVEEVSTARICINVIQGCSVPK